MNMDPTHVANQKETLRNAGKDILADLIQKECQDIDPEFSAE